MNMDPDTNTIIAKPAVRIALLAWAAFLVFVVVCTYLLWPWENALGVIRGMVRIARYMLITLVLLQLALGFILTGHQAAPEIRFRTCIFSIVSVLAVYVCTALVLETRYMSFSTFHEMDNTMRELMTWHSCRELFLRYCAPVCAGILMHCNLYTFHEMRRLGAAKRNIAGSFLITMILILGWSGLGFAAISTSRILDREMEEANTACARMIDATDELTRRFVVECPGEYQFLLLRANFLQDNGRLREASMSYEQVCAMTNTPDHVRKNIALELTAGRRKIDHK